MLDRLYLPLLALVTVAVIAFAAVWPQGLGARSPAPFGSTPLQQTPAMKAAMLREHNAAQRRAAEAREAIRALQSRTIAPTQ